jgi:hypothetical protein
VIGEDETTNVDYNNAQGGMSEEVEMAGVDVISQSFESIPPPEGTTEDEALLDTQTSDVDPEGDTEVLLEEGRSEQIESHQEDADVEVNQGSEIVASEETEGDAEVIGEDETTNVDYNNAQGGMSEEVEMAGVDVISQSFESIPPSEGTNDQELEPSEGDPILPTSDLDESLEDSSNLLDEENEDAPQDEMRIIDLEIMALEGQKNEGANATTEDEAPLDAQTQIEEETGDVIMFPDEEERGQNKIELEDADVELDGDVVVSEEPAEDTELMAESQLDVQNNFEIEEPQDANEENYSGPGNSASFDDISSEHIGQSTLDQQPDVAENEEDSNTTTGNGFTYHILQPKVKGRGVSGIPIAAVVGLLGFLICVCCIRRLRRSRSRYSKPSRGKYSAIGSEDFFNGTFSDDISFNGKDSDDEMSYGSDDDYGDGVKIELSSIHEMEANGGLTLEEING